MHDFMESLGSVLTQSKVPIFLVKGTFLGNVEDRVTLDIGGLESTQGEEC